MGKEYGVKDRHWGAVAEGSEAERRRDHIKWSRGESRSTVKHETTGLLVSCSKYACFNVAKQASGFVLPSHSLYCVYLVEVLELVEKERERWASAGWNALGKPDRACYAVNVHSTAAWILYREGVILHSRCQRWMHFTCQSAGDCMILWQLEIETYSSCLC